jgi:predicted nucleotidyltransferase
MNSIPHILRALTDADVKFVLVGGFAVQLHGFVRATFDLDLVLAMDGENLERFIVVARGFGLEPVAPVSLESLADGAKIEQWYREKGMIAFALREPQLGGSVVDVIVRPGISFNELLAHAAEVDLFGRKIKIAGIDDLVTMKRIADRPRDRIDIEALEKIQKGQNPNV